MSGISAGLTVSNCSTGVRKTAPDAASLFGGVPVRGGAKRRARSPASPVETIGSNPDHVWSRSRLVLDAAVGFVSVYELEDAKLKDESTKYWWFGPAELKELYLREQASGNTPIIGPKFTSDRS